MTQNAYLKAWLFPLNLGNKPSFQGIRSPSDPFSTSQAQLACRYSRFRLMSDFLAITRALRAQAMSSREAFFLSPRYRTLENPNSLLIMANQFFTLALTWEV